MICKLIYLIILWLSVTLLTKGQIHVWLNMWYISRGPIYSYVLIISGNKRRWQQASTSDPRDIQNLKQNDWSNYQLKNKISEEEAFITGSCCHPVTELMHFLNCKYIFTLDRIIQNTVTPSWFIQNGQINEKDIYIYFRKIMMNDFLFDNISLNKCWLCNNS